MSDTHDDEIQHALDAMWRRYYRLNGEISFADAESMRAILAENTCPECGHTFGWHRIPGRETSGCSHSPYSDLASVVKDCDV